MNKPSLFAGRTHSQILVRHLAIALSPIVKHVAGKGRPAQRGYDRISDDVRTLTEMGRGPCRSSSGKMREIHRVGKGA
ncbi:MAG: hypothetical protein DMF61_26430 [Blastocatellia bacterium AA13]|nr:MAG: hypothetical protein DMF61_26430 [Blastocatellia bacterium AA13]